MLSEALTSLEEVKSRLQESLRQQPEYRALLVIDQATSQLAEVFGPADLDVAVRPKSRVEDIAVSTAGAALPPYTAALDAEDVVDAAVPNVAPPPGPAAIEEPQSVVDAPPRAVAADEPASLADAPHLTPAIFRMAAVLRELATAATGAAQATDQKGSTPVSTMAPSGLLGDADADPPPMSPQEAPVAGLPAASYESPRRSRRNLAFG